MSVTRGDTVTFDLPNGECVTYRIVAMGERNGLVYAERSSGCKLVTLTMSIEVWHDLLGMAG